MKTTSKLTTVLFSSIALTSLSTAEVKPTGSFVIGDGSDAVAEGTRPSITWNINHPGPPVTPTLTTTADTNVSVTMLGTSIVIRRQKRFTDTEMQLSNGGPWTHIFRGIDVDVDPTKVLVSQAVPKGTTIGFRTRRDDGGGVLSPWRYFDPSDTNNHHVEVLRNGDALPSIGADHSQAQIEDVLSKYVNEEQTHAVLDDNQVIMLVEMGFTQPGDRGYDLQDVVVLLTFTEPTETAANQ